jgi:DHA1 family multidrug resistance protein-like MFS transporter
LRGAGERLKIRLTRTDIRYVRRPTGQLPLLLGFGLGSLAWNVCAPFLPLRIQQLGVGDLAEVARQAGSLVGLSGLLNAGLAPAWSQVGSTYGYRLQVLRAHLGTGLGWMLYGLARTPAELAGSAIVLGSFSGNYPHYVALAAGRAAPAEVGRAVGDLQAASQIGNTIGPLVGAAVATRLGVGATFFVCAALSLLAVCLVVLTIPPDAPTAPRQRASGGVGAALRRPGQRWLMALILAGDAGQIGMRPLIPVILSARLADPSAIATATGLATTLATGGTIVAAVTVGRISRRVSPRRVLALTLPLAALCTALVPLAPTVPALVALWTLAGLASGATTPGAFAWLGRIAPNQPTGFTLLASTSMATYAIGPLVLGQASAVNLDVPFYLAAATTALAAAIVLFRPPVGR